MSLTNQNIDLFFKTAIDLVKSAGDVFLEGFSKQLDVIYKHNLYADLVTEYDKKLEEILISQLSQKFPTHKFIGEESTHGSAKLSEEPTWMIDPIDGTTNFIHKNPNCCISVAFVLKKEPYFGIIYSPVQNHLYTAQKGKGAFLNGKPIHASKTEDITKSLIATEISMAQYAPVHDVLMKRTDELILKAHGMRSIGSAALTLCYVATGALDVFQADHLQCWDYAAGAVIVREAGGVMINTDGSPFDVMKRMFIAAGTEKLANEVVKVLKEADKKLEVEKQKGRIK